MAKALNLFFAYAAKRGFKWVFTLDQDSICSSRLLHHLGKYAMEDVAVVGPNVIYKGNEAFRCPVFEKTKRVPWVITSGSLTNIDAWNHIGDFDEKLFIDGVDKDFCLRAERENYAVYKDYGVWILHALGNLRCQKVAGRVIYVTNHEPWRVYYMVRNAVYLDAKLGLREGRADICKIMIKILLFEKKKLSKLGAVLHGIADGVSISA